jgi:hypothetical protein
MDEMLFSIRNSQKAKSDDRAQRPIDPRTELTTVKQLRDGFGDLDKLINSLK